MKRIFFYTKYALRCFRIISIVCSILLLIIEPYNIQYLTREISNLQESFPYSLLICDIINIITLFFFMFSTFFPKKFGGLSIVAFLYATTLIIFEPENYMGILMFFLGTSLLFVRGLLKKHKKTKLILLGILLLVLCLTSLRFGVKVFLNYFITNLGGILVISIFIFFMRSYYANTLIYEDKKLNLASFPKLTERDCRILQKIQKGEKYIVIAKDENITEGSLKNRLHFVFDTMETGDKQGFLSYYDDWELYYKPDNLEKMYNKSNPKL